MYPRWADMALTQFHEISGLEQGRGKGIDRVHGEFLSSQKGVSQPGASLIQQQARLSEG